MIGEIDDAFNSKIAYKSGISLFESGNYADAIAELSKVLPKDADCNDAEEKKTTAIQKYKEQVLNEVKDSTSKKDWIKAIEILKTGVAILPDDVDLAAKVKTCEKEYISNLIADAEKVFSDYTKYEDALKIIQSGLQYFPEDQFLAEKREYYNSFAPVKLSDLKEYDKRHMVATENHKDAKGNNHHTVFYSSYGDAYAVYLLDSKYNRFNLTIFGLSPGSDYYSGVSINDFSGGDDDKAVSLYADKQIKQSVFPYEIELDVTGVQMLKIECQKGVAVGDCVLQKTVK